MLWCNSNLLCPGTQLMLSLLYVWLNVTDDTDIHLVHYRFWMLLIVTKYFTRWYYRLCILPLGGNRNSCKNNTDISSHKVAYLSIQHMMHNQHLLGAMLVATWWIESYIVSLLAQFLFSTSSWGKCLAIYLQNAPLRSLANILLCLSAIWCWAGSVQCVFAACRTARQDYGCQRSKVATKQ